MRDLPQLLHTYDRHHLLEGSRWLRFPHRAGDIVVSTSYKAGTTWVQTIIANLLFQDGVFPAPVSVMGPWLEMRLRPAEADFATLAAQTWRRQIKTHLPLSGLPYHLDVRYVVVGRDGRDVFMSMLNHHQNYTDSDATDAGAVRRGGRRPLRIRSRRATRVVPDLGASFPWEHDGYPYWSHLTHFASWWEYRHLPNIHLVHFADLLADAPGTIRALAAFLDITIDAAAFPGILTRISFAHMREHFATQIEPMADVIWKEGGYTFMNRGTNGRWRELLGAEELASYDTAVARTLAPDAVHWLAHGGALPA